jgi:hypothetical protein
MNTDKKQRRKSKNGTFAKPVRDIFKIAAPDRHMTQQAATLLTNLSTELVDQLRTQAIFSTSRSSCQTLTTPRCMPFILKSLPPKVRKFVETHNKHVVEDYHKEVAEKKETHAKKMAAMSKAEMKQHKEKYDAQFNRS